MEISVNEGQRCYNTSVSRRQDYIGNKMTWNKVAHDEAFVGRVTDFVIHLMYKSGYVRKGKRERNIYSKDNRLAHMIIEHNNLQDL